MAFKQRHIDGLKGAACLLTISDSFVTKQELSAEDRQNAFADMMKLALESAIVL